MSKKSKKKRMRKMSNWDAESLINQDAIDNLSEEDAEKILEILIKAGY